MAVALAILGVVGGFAGPAIKVAKSIAAPVGRQFSYLCCFRSNIKTLNDEAKTLEDKTSGLQAKVKAARDNARPIFSEVETWLSDSEEMQKGINGILREAPDMERGCLKLRERYSLSRKAKKKANAIKELVEKCKFNDDTISYPPAPAASAPVESATKANEFESRREVEEKIMKSLEDKKVYKIGIAGMGGLGKTTMARKIMDRARGEGLFKEAVMAVVSQPVDKLNIQLQIGEQLGVTTFKEITTLIPRAHILRERLRGNKRTLLVLDDVWEKNLDMEELGIPCEDGCKVLLTSRDKGVFKAMDVKEVRELKILDEREAWILFSDKAGICVDDDALLNTIARNVMRECKGLPLALAIVGKALEGVNNIASWKDALEQLQKHNPSDIEDVIQLVYNPLKLSYDRLGNENAKSMLLLCCLFAEDYDIPLEHLTYFAMGLQWFEKDWDLEKVRGRICTLIENLKSRCLLLDGYNKDHVKMHDVVRDVSIFIASKELKQVKCRSSCTTCTGRCTCPCTCTWISSHVDGGARHVPPHQSCFPKLKLLLMNDKVEDEMDNLIGGSTKLNVLFIEKYNLMKSLPTHKMSLTTLVLLSCNSLESIAIVGQLESLEILIFRSCRSIKELPEQVRGLKCLKLLKISRCEKLKRIAVGVISSLVALEELKIVDSFNDWKGGEIDEERNEASLREIESLKKLRCLKIDVSDIALAAQPLYLSYDKLVQFTVRFGKIEYDFGERYVQSYQKRMYLRSRDESDIIDFGDLSANKFLTRAECLSLSAIIENNQDFNLNLATVQNLRWLNLESFTNKKNITSAAVAAASFPLLDFLGLIYLYKLEEIWDDAPIPSNSFNNLKELRLFCLGALKRMGKCVLSTSNDFFLQLEAMEIVECIEMEHLVLVPNVEEQEKEDHSTVLIFPKLKTVQLHNLPKLANLICSSRGIESIQFPLLAEMGITNCENLKWLVSRDDDGDHYEDDEDDSLHLFCNPKVSFGSLKKLVLDRNMESKNVWCDKVPIGFFRGLVELIIFRYGNIRRLFSSSSKIPQNLVNLRVLIIERCPEMVKVIEDDEEVSSSSSSSSCDHPTNPTTTPLFPSLQQIELWGLPKLESFCEWRCALELPFLKKVRIDKCEEMKSFNAGAGSLIITPALQTVRINNKDLECGDDLNAALHQHFEKEKEQREAREVAYRNRMAEEEEEEEEEGSREGHERNVEIDDSSTISTEDG